MPSIENKDPKNVKDVRKDQFGLKDLQNNFLKTQSQIFDKEYRARPKQPPSPPPLPTPPVPVKLCCCGPQPCFFNDGLRKIDFVLVYMKDQLDDVEVNIKISNFLIALEGFGLELEGETGKVDNNMTFVKVHGDEKLLIHYAKLCNINLVMDSPFYFPAKPPFFGFMQNELNAPHPEFSDVYSRAPETFAGTRLKRMSDAERIMVVYQLMKLAQYGPNREDRSLKRLLEEDVFKKAYPIHDGLTTWTEEGELCDRQILRRYWSKCNQSLKSQPIQLIEKYFGPDVAFYFAFMEFYTIMLVPMAVLSFVSLFIGLVNMVPNSEEICSGLNDVDLCPSCTHYDICDFRKLSDFCLKKKISYVFDNPFVLFLAVCTSIWAHVLVIFWKREERKLAVMWDLDHMVISDVHRPEYIEKATVTKLSSATGLPEKYVSNQQKYCRIAITYIICLFLVLLIVASVIGVAVLRLTLLLLLTRMSNAQIVAALISSMISVGIMCIFSAINAIIAIKLTEMEIPRTQWEFENSLVYKTFLMEFVITLTPSFYLAFFKGRLFKHPGNVHPISVIATLQWDHCDVSGCGLELAIQLFFTMFYIHYGTNLIALIYPACKICCQKNRNSIDDEDYENLPRWEQDWFLVDISTYHVHSEYMQIALKYGFVVCFVAVFPLAPLLEIFSNIIEIRWDAYKLTNLYNRRVPQQVPGLGAWLDIFRLITHLGTVTNAFVIAFTSEFISRMIYRFRVDFNLNGYSYSTLSKFSTDDFPVFNGTELKPDIDICYYTGKRNPPDHPKKYELTDDYWYEISLKFLFAVLFEHLMLLFNHFLQLLIPKVSHTVRRRLKFERHQVREARLRILNEAYKRRREEIVRERKRQMKLQRTGVLEENL